MINDIYFGSKFKQIFLHVGLYDFNHLKWMREAIDGTKWREIGEEKLVKEKKKYILHKNENIESH